MLKEFLLMKKCLKPGIYNPKKDLDILSGIKLSAEKMSLIDKKIKELYIN